LKSEKIMKRLLLIALVFTLTTPVLAEDVRIPWHRNFMHDDGGKWSSENKYKSGLSRDFNNGAPEEGSKVVTQGELKAELIVPKDSKGPVPFMVLMHGCSGFTPIVMKWAHTKAKIFLDQGVGVLILDSFTTRNVHSTCGAPNYHWGLRRVEDAYSALEYLVEKGYAQKDQVYVMGRSNGALAVLMIAQAFEIESHAYHFAGGFSVSPSCIGLTKSDFASPVVVFIGTKDEAGDSKICAEMRQDTKVPLRVVVYKGVYHGFEDNTPTYVYHGWHMEHNPKADKDSTDQILSAIKSKNFTRGVEQKTL
jgi:dienelactone hydrolase